LAHPKETFEDNIQLYQKEFKALDKKDKQLSIIRFALFAVCMALIIYAVNNQAGVLLFTVLLSLIVLFGFMLRVHNQVKFKKNLSIHLSKLNEEELQRLSGNFSGLSQGDVYFERDHPYAPDLDIFGSNSLFQLIIRSRLLHSQNLAAKWMLNPANRETILQRQEATKELAEMANWRQEFTAYGMNAELAQSANQLSNFAVWMSTRNDFVEKPFWKIIGWLMPSISLLLIMGIWLFELPYQVLFAPLIINAFFLKVTLNPLFKMTKNFEKVSKSLAMYGHLFASIETNEFESNRLKSLKEKLFNNQHLASKSIRRLGAILDQLQNRANMLYMPINALFLLDLFWLRQGEKWKRKNRNESIKWFEAVHEFDVLSDMASFAFANPKYAYPEIVNANFNFKAGGLGHPLIHSSKRISNSFKFKNKGFVGLITGSNMSGKSTFLRTVGLNLTMAQMGLPVCAKSFSFSLTRLFTGMRTTDSLEESVSSFYAELERIKSLLDSINDDEPMMYLLDEILKGTNSDDRNRGSISLINQLNQKNALGLISTHDLTLSSLEEGNSLIKNYSFNSTIEGDEILFDYKLTDGPCRSFNASKLMEKMGIIVE